VFKIERQIKELRLERERAGDVLASERGGAVAARALRPILTAFKQCSTICTGHGSQSALGKALAYTVRQWPKLVLHQSTVR